MNQVRKWVFLETVSQNCNLCLVVAGNRAPKWWKANQQLGKVPVAANCSRYRKCQGFPCWLIRSMCLFVILWLFLRPPNCASYLRVILSFNWSFCLLTTCFYVKKSPTTSPVVNDSIVVPLCLHSRYVIYCFQTDWIRVRIFCSKNISLYCHPILLLIHLQWKKDESEITGLSIDWGRLIEWATCCTNVHCATFIENPA